MGRPRRSQGPRVRGADSSCARLPVEGGALRLLITPYKGRIALLSAVSLTSALLEAFFIVLLTAIAMALVAGSDEVGPMLGLTFPIHATLSIAAGSLLLRVIFSLWGVGISAQLTAVVTDEQRKRLSHAFLRTSWAVQQTEPTGRLQELLTSFVARITETVSTLSMAITAGVSLVAFLGAGMAVDPQATAAVLVALALVGGILSPLRRAVRSHSRSYARASLGFANAVSELGSLGFEMQTYGLERRFEDKIDDLSETAALTLRRTREVQNSVPHIYTFLAYGAVLGGLAALSWVGFADLGAMGAVMLLMLRSINYGQQVAMASAAVAGYRPFLEDVEATVRRYSEATKDRGRERPAAVVPLEADGVAFAYTPERIALSGVGFTLEPGEAIGVIGPSGAGKSTLAQLLLGLRGPSRGTVRAAGVLLQDIDHDWWTSRVAFVAQDALLFTGTVAENIRFFRDDLSETDLRDAARQANILSDIEALPHGFDTHLGERGSQLSGGQRQRLSIARALVGRPNLLILDEPTSALDGESEALIRNTLAALHGQLSVIIIAHRMSTLDICDRIMVIEAGCMTALGTPSALVADSDFYRNALAVAGIDLM